MNHATWDFHFRGITSHLSFHSSSKQTSVFQMTSFKVLRIIYVHTDYTTSDKVRVRYYSLGMYLYLEYLLEYAHSRSLLHTPPLCNGIACLG